MKRLLELVLVVSALGCGTNQRSEDTGTARIVESHQRTGAEAAQKDMAVPTAPPGTASMPVPETVSADTHPDETVASAASPDTAGSDLPVEDHPLLEVTVAAPVAALTLREVNQRDFCLHVQLKNSGSKTLTLWPYLSVEIIDSRGKAVPRSMNLGRFGFRSTPSIIEGMPFVSLDPGGVHEIEINLKQYRFDPKVITGWQFSRPGKYEITLIYVYDRTRAKIAYGKGCGNLDRADAPWNLAMEIRETKRVALRITK